MQIKLLVLILLSFSLSAHSENIDQKGYYTVEDSSSQYQAQATKDFAKMSLAQIELKIQEALSLLKFIFHSNNPPAAHEKYQRVKHFGHWINDPNDNTCFNTRNKILVSDSLEDVTYSPSNHCVVKSGKWYDPYTDSYIYDAKDIQIDHLVPLKNAYESGADKWDYNARCLYANFLGNQFQLLAVSGHENMSKGDHDPSQYLPPNEKYLCQYIRQWLAVKLIWKLRLTPSETQAIRDSIQSEKCSTSDFEFSESDLESQRQYIRDNYNLCAKNNI